MTLQDFKKRLEKKALILEAQQVEHTKTLVMIKHDLAKAERDEAMVSGALQQVRFEISEIDLAIQAAELASKSASPSKAPAVPSKSP